MCTYTFAAQNSVWTTRGHIIQLLQKLREPVKAEFKPSLSITSHCHPKQKRNPGYAYNRDSQLEAHRIWIMPTKQFSLATEKLAGSEANHVVLLFMLGAGCTVSCVCLIFTGSANLS